MEAVKEVWTTQDKTLSSFNNRIKLKAFREKKIEIVIDNQWLKFLEFVKHIHYLKIRFIS